MLLNPNNESVNTGVVAGVSIGLSHGCLPVKFKWWCGSIIEGVCFESSKKEGAMSASKISTSEVIDGAVGKLEVRLDVPDMASMAGPVAVVCHPHPVHGGTMDNKVVYSLARELAALNLVVARFNFRGVGASEGSYDDGNGETDDLLAVIAMLRGRYPQRPLWLAGFSFGGYIAARVSSLCAAQQTILVAPAVTRDYFDVEVSVENPGLLIQGSDDQLIAPAAVRQWAEQQPGQFNYEELAGADHFFHGKLNELRELVRDYGRKALTVE